MKDRCAILGAGLLGLILGIGITLVIYLWL